VVSVPLVSAQGSKTSLWLVSRRDHRQKLRQQSNDRTRTRDGLIAMALEGINRFFFGLPSKFKNEGINKTFFRHSHSNLLIFIC